MVSLDKRGEYLKGILENEKFHIFYIFLISNGVSVETKNLSTDIIDENFVAILTAICNSDRQNFQKYYTQYSTRAPSTSSPFVNDDYLIFSLIVGVKKFNISYEWLEKVMHSRKCSSEDCSLSLTTFKNIMSENYNSLDNHFGIILILQSLLKEEYLTQINKTKLYSSITSEAFPSKKSDFLNIAELRSFDLLINEQLIKNDGEYQIFKSKVHNAEKRIIQIANATFITICLILFGSVVWLYSNHDLIKEMVQNLEAIFGFLGLSGIIPMFIFREKLISFFARIIENFFFGAHSPK